MEKSIKTNEQSLEGVEFVYSTGENGQKLLQKPNPDGYYSIASDLKNSDLLSEVNKTYKIWGKLNDRKITEITKVEPVQSSTKSSSTVNSSTSSFSSRAYSSTQGKASSPQTVFQTKKLSENFDSSTGACGNYGVKNRVIADNKENAICSFAIVKAVESVKQFLASGKKIRAEIVAASRFGRSNPCRTQTAYKSESYYLVCENTPVGYKDENAYLMNPSPVALFFDGDQTGYEMGSVQVDYGQNSKQSGQNSGQFLIHKFRTDWDSYNKRPILSMLSEVVDGAYNEDKDIIVNISVAGPAHFGNSSLEQGCGFKKVQNIRKDSNGNIIGFNCVVPANYFRGQASAGGTTGYERMFEFEYFIYSDAYEKIINEENKRPLFSVQMIQSGTNNIKATASHRIDPM